VADHQHAAAIGRQRLFQQPQTGEVEVVGRFVENEEVAAAFQNLRQQQPRFFPAGEVADQRVDAVVFEEEPLEVPPHRNLLGAELDGVDALADLVGHGLLRVEFEAGLVDVVEFHRRGDLDFAPVRRQLPGDDFKQTALADSVRPDQPDTRARFEFEREVADDRPPAERERNSDEVHRLVAKPRRRRNQELHLAVADRAGLRGDLVEPLHSPHVALEPRLGRPPHPVDFGTQETAALLLEDVFVGLAFRLDGEEFGVTAGVTVEFAVVEFHDAVRHAVEKITVVGDKKTAPAILGEEVLNPLHRGHVEVVGRLVEQQEIGLGNDRAREGDPAHFAAGEPVAGTVRIARQVQLLQHGVELGFKIPAVVNHQLVFKLAVLGGIDRDSLEFPLEFAEPTEAVGDVVADAAVVVQLEILRQCRHSQPARPGDVPGTRQLFFGDQPQQRRFAAAVAADQGDALSRIDMKFSSVVNRLPPDGETKILRRPQNRIRHIPSIFLVFW